MLMHRSQKRMAGTISLHEVSPHLAAISSSCITMPGLESRGDSPVTLESIDLEVSILPTKTKPKKISMIGSDGHRHTYLFKGLEDLHLDERIMQFMAIINNMFARDNKLVTFLYWWALIRNVIVDMASQCIMLGTTLLHHWGHVRGSFSGSILPHPYLDCTRGGNSEKQ